MKQKQTYIYSTAGKTYFASNAYLLHRIHILLQIHISIYMYMNTFAYILISNNRSRGVIFELLELVDYQQFCRL